MAKTPNTFVINGDGVHDTWTSDDENHYAWGVGPAGDLMIFRAIYHAAFSVKMSDNDTKWYCYAAGTWNNVEVIDTPEEVEDAT